MKEEKLFSKQCAIRSAERMPPCGAPLSKPEMGERGDAAMEEGFVTEEQRRNECPPVMPPFQNQKWGDEVTRGGGEDIGD
jgi:hypothetical protein